MTQIKIKRVYEDSDPSDGYRVLVDRLWPRGVKKESLKYDLWAKDITPSNALRKMFHENKEANWKDFVFLYQKELSESDAVKSFIEDIKQHDTITLLFASADREKNHAIILKSYLEKFIS